MLNMPLRELIEHVIRHCNPLNKNWGWDKLDRSSFVLICMPGHVRGELIEKRKFCLHYLKYTMLLWTLHIGALFVLGDVFHSFRYPGRRYCNASS